MKITITQQGKVPVKEGGVGLFFEDINYALDGGLHAEMLENRNFEAKNVRILQGRYLVEHDGGYAWSPYPEGADVALKVKTDRPLVAENPHYMRIVVGAAGVGMKNKAYDGIYLTQGTVYKISFYVRSFDYKNHAAVGIYQGGSPVFEKKVKIKADGKWHRYAVRFKAKANVDRAAFVFRLLKEGMVHADCFSMLPADAILGVFRRDLVGLMSDLKPGFLRFPGGCVVEGNTLENRYRWKDSVGAPEHRRHNWNRWAVHGTEEGKFGEFSHYGQTLGVGFYEYFRLCEYLGCKPLPVLSVGIACQFMSKEFVPLEDPELEGYIQDALDLIEFANGGKETEWGGLRAELGHPEPFGLEYLALGNEQWEEPAKEGEAPTSNQFFARFDLFAKRIRERYPEIKLIATAGPDVGTKTHSAAWAWIRSRLQEDPDFVYCTDEHFYNTPQWFYEHVHTYDDYPRQGLVYAGEYAAHTPSEKKGDALEANCWESALAEAAFLTGCERNADVVVMKSYAPLFGRLGNTMWSPDLIRFDGRRAYVTANYYVQKLFSLCTGSISFPTETDTADTYASATERDGLTFVKVVNAGTEPVEAEVEADFAFGELAQILQMEGDLSDYNAPGLPEKLVPHAVAPTGGKGAVVPPHSFNVLIFRK